MSTGPPMIIPEEAESDHVLQERTGESREDVAARVHPDTTLAQRMLSDSGHSAS